MRILFEFDDTSIKMHAEGVGNDQSQKIEKTWACADVRLYNADGDCETTIALTSSGSLSVLDGEQSPFSQASKVVEPEPEPVVEPAAPEGEHTEESGFRTMSQHADEAPAEEHHD